MLRPPIRTALWLIACATLWMGCGDETSEDKFSFLLFHDNGIGLPNTSPSTTEVRITAWDASKQRVLETQTFPVDSGQYRMDGLPFDAGVQFFFEGLDGIGTVVSSAGTRPLRVNEQTDQTSLLAFMVLRDAFSPASTIRQGASGLVSRSSEFIDASARAGHATATLPDGRVLILGGAQVPNTADPKRRTTLGLIYDTILVWDPQIGEFEPLFQEGGTQARLTSPRAFHAATVLDDGRVLVTGGVSPTGTGLTTLVSAEIIQLSADDQVEILAVAPMSVPRAYHTATRRNDGTVLLVGGRMVESDVETVLATADVFDPASNSFFPTNPMSVPRAGHSASLLADGLSVLIGGGTDDTTVHASTEFFTIDAENRLVFLPATNLTQGRYGHDSETLPLDGGRYIVFAGGFVDNGAGEFLPSATVEVVDSASGNILTPAIMQRGRAWFDLVPVGHNRFLAAGGVAEAGGGALGGVSEAELLVFADDAPTFQSVPVNTQMRTARYHYDALPLDNGMILFSGGTDGAVTHGTADLFNPGIPEIVTERR